MTDRAFDVEIARVAVRQAGVFASRQYDRDAVTAAKARRRRRSGQWEELARGVYRLAGASTSWHQQLWAAYLEAGPDSVVSHSSAARLLGLRGVRAASAVEITKLHDRNHRTTLSSLHHTRCLPSSHVTVVDGLPCTTVARTVFDLAGSPPRWARGRPRAMEVHGLRMARVFNNALADNGLTIDRMAEVLAALGRRGRSGTALTRHLLKEIGGEYVPTASELEAMFVALVRSVGLPEPDRQAAVGDADGTIGRVDFVYRQANVIVEVDGGPWHDGPLDRDLDVSRELRLRAAGWTVVRLRWHQLVNEPELVIAALSAALTATTAQAA